MAENASNLTPLGADGLSKFAVREDTNELFFNKKPVKLEEVHKLGGMAVVWTGVVAIAALIAALSTGFKNAIDIYEYYRGDPPHDVQPAAPPTALETTAPQMPAPAATPETTTKSP